MSLLIKNVILNGEKKDIYIEKEKIKKIGKNLNLKAKEKIDGKGKKAVLPGLVNCHTHSAMILLRGLADDFQLEVWLKEKIWPIEKKFSPDDIYWGTKLAILEMIKSGTVCFNEMYWYEEAIFEAVKEMKISAVIGLVMMDFSSGGSKEKVEKLFNKLKNQVENIKLAVAPHAIYTVCQENLIWAKNFALKNRLLLHFHLSETKKEVEECLKKYKVRPVEYLNRIGFLGENTILAHSIWLNDKEIEILKKRNCSLVYCPTSNMKLTSGVFPYKKIKEKKINVCLGTDGPASNNSLDMFSEMKFASLLQKINEMDPTVASANEIFKIATENGAKALKIGSGKIKVGEIANLMLVDLDKISLIPNYNLISNLVYSASGDCVSDLICFGKILMRERKVEDEEKIVKNARKRSLKIIKFQT
jgi:5-methylthioadenosine/S-adenosylhomocysteine deaminase